MARIIDLFAGPGGWDLGAKAHGTPAAAGRGDVGGCRMSSDERHRDLLRLADARIWIAVNQLDNGGDYRGPVEGALRALQRVHDALNEPTA